MMSMPVDGRHVEPFDVVDHLVVASIDLDQGVRTIDELLGCGPGPGGRHPDWGTHNALLGLGGSTYLEVIAPDPESLLESADRPAVFTKPGSGLINGWVAVHRDIPAALSVADAMGHPLGAPINGRRSLPDGRELSWTLTDPHARHFDGLAPILIDWGHSPHPAASAPAGCRLVDFRLQHPDPGALAAFLGALEVPVVVEQGEVPLIMASIEGPNGLVTLT